MKKFLNKRVLLENDGKTMKGVLKEHRRGYVVTDEESMLRFYFELELYENGDIVLALIEKEKGD